MGSELRDIKAPVGMPFNFWLLGIIVAVVLIVGIFVYFKYFKKSKVRNEDLEPVILKTPWEIACEQFAALEKAGYLKEGKIDIYFDDLSDVVRQYFEGQFAIKAPEMTTEEFLHYLKNASVLDGEQKNKLKEFLNSCDMVKFAKYRPDMSEAHNCFVAAKDFVREIYEKSQGRGGDHVIRS